MSRFLVAQSILESTASFLREVGRDGYEAFVLWSGVGTPEGFEIRTAHMPAQTAFRTDQGLLVRVEGDALHELNLRLLESKEILAAQVHAHPTDAFHSDTDDTFPIVTTVGGLSIVAADFAAHGVLNSSTAVFRLKRGKGWVQVPRRRIRKLFRVTA